MTASTQVTIDASDHEKFRAFFDGILASLSWTRVADLDDNGEIWGMTVSLEAPNRAAVKAFHETALAE